MKKVSFLVLALIVGLPGCGCKNQKSACSIRKNSIEKYMDTQGSVENMNVSSDSDEEIEEEIKEELEAFDFGDDDDDMLDEYENDLDLMMNNLDEDNDDDDNDDDDTKNTEFSWVDAQSDDEFKRLYFSFNHYGIREDQKESMHYDIEQIKQLLTESGSSAQPIIVVEGHTDQEGSPAYNLGLSEKRAKTVADILVAAGVSKNLIKVVGRGQECPVMVNGKVINGSREEREPNRRVEIRVIYT